MATRLTEPPSGGSNVTDETRRDFLRKAISAREDAETYHGIYRNVLKAAKKAGCNTKEMVAAMNAKKRDLPEVITDVRDYVRFLSLLNMPVTQEELFPTQQETHGDQRAADDLVWDAGQAGYAAGKAGRKIDDCPYHAGSEQDAEWRKQWHRGQEHLVMTTMPKAETPADTGRKKPGTGGTRGRRAAAGELKPATPEDVKEALAEDDAAAEGPETVN